MLEKKKIFILGMAKSGFEAAKLLAFYHNDILITDCKEQDSDQVRALRELGVTYIVSDHPEELLDATYDCVIKNPGIPRDHQCVVKAIQLKIPVINEVEAAYHFLPKDVSIIGVTGSNGKTTTVTILYQLLKEMGLPVHLGGNIGVPLCSLVPNIKSHDILVLEISDHQLYDMYEFKADISILTNLTETHLDFNKTYDNYKKIKKRIFQNQTSDDLTILNKDNSDVMEISMDIPSRKLYFSSREEADICIKEDAIYYQNQRVILLDHIRVQGIHNYENIMCAIAAAKQFGVTDEIIKEVLNDFSGVEHRLEYVRKLEEREFYNDSKATNPKSTQIALGSFHRPTILIMGGVDRKIGFDSLIDYMHQVTHVLAMGETQSLILELCQKHGIDCVPVESMEEAVRVAYNLSEPGDVILLSPACASWDMYPNFEARGTEYKKYVEQLG